MARQNGGIIGVANNPTGPASTNIAKGMWSLVEQTKHRKAGNWPISPIPITSLVVAGGGSGGSNKGGGGGGGAATESSSTITSPTWTYQVTIGAGGAATTGINQEGNSGSSSVFINTKSPGLYGYRASGTGGASGSGSSGGSGDVSQNGGGGGGSSSGGGNAILNTSAGNGGSGLSSSINGSTLGYGGGGGGGSASSSGRGTGTDGGGDGGNNNQSGSSGTANRGGGGGGSGDNAAVSGQGGSGVVILKIPDTNSATFSAGVTSSLSTAVSGYKIYTVTAAGPTDTVTFS